MYYNLYARGKFIERSENMRKIPVAAVALMLFFANLSYAAQPTQEEIQKYNLYFNNGVSYLKNKKYSSAIIEFKKVLRFQPYDSTVRQSLCSAYLARAEHYLNEEKNPKKAIIDLKSALFYMKFWENEQNSAQLTSMANSTQNSLLSLQKKYEGNLSVQQKFQNAKNLRAQGELPAAAYDFLILNNTQFEKDALENVGDIFKALNNKGGAMESYRNALKIDPKSAKLHFKYAVILDEVNNEDAAAQEYNLALKYGEKNTELLDILENLWRSRTVNNPNDAQAYINLGTVFQMKGDYASSKNQYIKALSLAPNDKTANLNLASLYIAQGLNTMAIGQYNKLLAKNPNDIEIINYKAAAYEAQKDYKNALAQYKAILAIKPDDNNAKNAIADIIANKFTPEQKYDYMMLEANSNPQNYDLQYAYAYEMHKQKKYNDAITYYKRAMALNPKKQENYINIAQIYTLQNDYQSALDILNQGIAQIPYGAELLTQKDNILKSQAGQTYETASKMYEGANYKGALENYLKINPQTPEVQLAIANCYYELKDYSNAVAYYEKVLQKDSKNQDVLYVCAMSYNELNNQTKALELLDKIVSLNPNNANAKEAISAIKEATVAKDLEDAIEKYEQKDFTNALALINKILSQNSKNTYALYYKGLIFEEQKNQKEANAQFKLAIDSDNNFALAYYSYALGLDNLEKYQEAIANYDKFLEIKAKEGVSDEYTKFATDRVSELRKFLNTK